MVEMAPDAMHSVGKRKASEHPEEKIRSLPRPRCQPETEPTQIRGHEVRQESANSVAHSPMRAQDVARNTTPDVRSTSNEQEAAPTQASRSDAQAPSTPVDKTFRLRGVPKGWGKIETQQRIKERLNLDESMTVSIRSLSTNPFRSEERVATLEFSKNPSTALGDSTKTEWPIIVESHELHLDTHFLGMTPLHDADDASCGVDIVALSGLNGHAFGSFRSRTVGSTYMWLRDSLPNDIPAGRIFIYGYDTQMVDSCSFQNIGDLGQQLKLQISLVQKAATSQPKRQLIMIGHSLGGIIIKAAINKMFNGTESDRRMAKSIRGVMFFGVPNQGMNIQSLIAMVGERPNRELIQSLGGESQVLQDLSQRFQANFSSPTSEIFSFYETQQSPTAKAVSGKWDMSGPPTILVDRRSATNGRQWELDDDHTFPINRTHSDMVKLGSKHDVDYVVSLECLRRLQGGTNAKFAAVSGEENQKCLKSLSFLDMESRWDQIHTTSDTCDWLMHHSEYMKWIENPTGLLWIEGKPGTGKSVLMKYTLRSLREAPLGKGCVIASFFVYGQGSSLQKSRLGLLRAILHQILSQIPDLLHLVLPTYTERSQTMREWLWGAGELQTFLKLCLEHACKSRSVILLVDALDELEENVALEVVEYFQSLAGPSNKSISRLRICFSCRHYPTISTEGGYHICVEDENKRDICYVVSGMLSGIGGIDKILPLITEKANGVFQWAVLVSHEARKLSRQKMVLSHISRKIQDLPESLHKLYLGILNGLSWESIRLFQWICFANEPLNPFQLRHALAIGAEDSCDSLDECEERLGFEETPAGVTSMVKTLSKGLAQVSEEEGVWRPRQFVTFIHQSVKDFLMQGGFGKLETSLSANPYGLSYAYLSEACLKFLVTDRSRVFSPLCKQRFSIGCSKFESFGRYAFENWAMHAIQAEKYNQVPEYMREYLEASANNNDQKPANVVGNAQKDEHNAGVICPQQGSTRRRLPKFVQLLMQHNLKSSSRSPTDHTWFLAGRHKCRRTPFCLAVIDDAFITVKFHLVTGQANVNTRDSAGRTPLHHAVRSGSLKMVEALLASPSIRPNYPDNEGYTPLLHAVSNGSLEILEALLNSPTVDPNCSANRHGTPLLYAVELGSLGAIKALLESPKVNANFPMENGWTPFLFTVFLEQSREVEILLSLPGVDSNHQDDPRRAALLHSAELGLEAAVEKLISSSMADSNPEDDGGRSPLQYTVQDESSNMLSVLVESPMVSQNSRDINGKNNLSHAAEYGRSTVKRFLLILPESNENSEGVTGWTPLSYAIEKMSFIMFKSLIAECEADSDSMDDQR